MQKDNTLRNTRADEIRMKVLKGPTSLFSILSSKELKVISKYIRPYIKGVILLIVLALGLSFVEGFKMLSIIAFIKLLFTDSIGYLTSFKFMGRYEVGTFAMSLVKTRYGLIMLILSIFITLSVIGIIVKFLVMVLARKFQLNLIRNLRRDLYNKIVSFDIDFFNEAKSGELLFMINAEASRFSNFVLFTRSLLSASSTIIVFFAILLYMAPLVTGILFILVVIFLWLHQKIEKRLKISSWLVNFYRNNLQQIFYGIIYGIKLIKLGGLEEREREEYINYHKNFEVESMKVTKLKAFSGAVREAFFIFTLTLFSGIFLYLTSRKIMVRDGAFILAYMVVLLRTVPYFSQFQRSILDIIESYGPLTKIVEILTKDTEKRPALKKTGHKPLSSINNILIKDLTFSYKNKGDILKSININFSKGKMYAIVGFSGEGKSTLLDLIVGMRKPKKGGILFNDITLDEVEPAALKERIGYVNQEPLIFHDTIKENIAFFNKEAPIEKIDTALEMASIKDFVHSSASGLETGLGERGLTISGGERQRIGMARVFLKDAELLLLDEATNSLDYKTEKAIYDNVKKIKHGKIVIVVAHRLSSLVDFDEIVVLYNGRVEEKGVHKDLMERKGVYYNLYRLQESGKNI